MRFCTQQQDFYCGVDLHVRSMYLCILDREGKIVLHRNMPCSPEDFLQGRAVYHMLRREEAFDPDRFFATT